ncbi:MAG: CcoQ/FixQ family Cbb3-type cytochrome c oxidase assembly chaperone [Bacteroidetes bacterium]|nr:CcoQ/FixQ family Cbb3-type cytochrome c oxidase assembly chaperone [Bacteroidota bacterium]
MFKQFLSGVDGMEQYLIFSMIIFILFFTGVLIYVWRMKKEDVKELSNIPLTDQETELP